MKNLIKYHLFSLVTLVNTVVYLLMLLLSLLANVTWSASVVMLAGFLISGGFCFVSYRYEKNDWIKISFITLFYIILLPATYVWSGIGFNDIPVFLFLQLLSQQFF